METLNFTEDNQYEFMWHELVSSRQLDDGCLVRFITADNVANRFLIEKREADFLYGSLQREGTKMLIVKFETSQYFRVSNQPSFKIDGYPRGQVPFQTIKLEPITLLELDIPLQN